MTVFGGFTSTGRANDVWVLANANGQEVGTPAWTQLSPTGTPPSARNSHTAGYDPSTNRMMVFAGNGSQLLDFWLLTYATGVINVAVDIDPADCPNRLDVNSTNRWFRVRVAILGTDTFDVNNIDLNSVLLEGISPLRTYFRDVSTPFSNGGADPCLNCSEEGPDGKSDLLLKFSKNEVIAFLGEVNNGDCVEMTLTGQLVDGTPISGSDHILVKTTTLAEDLGDLIRRRLGR